MSDVVEKGSSVTVQYIGTLDDGTVFEDSYKNQTPLTFEVGSGQLIKGFDTGILGMSVGEKKTLNLTPDQAYGEHNSDRIHDVNIENFNKENPPEVDQTVIGQNELGQQMMARVLEINSKNVKLDFNHPLAGKNLQFQIEVVSINSES